MGFLGMNNYQLFCLLYVCFGASFYSFDTGITSSVFAYENFFLYFGLNNTTIGAFNAAYTAASAVGNLSNAYFGNKLGRLRTIRMASIISIIGVTLQTAAQNYAMLIVGRIIGGLGTGIAWTLCGLYASEIAPPQLRGRIGGYYSFNNSAGYMVSVWLGLAFYFLPGNSSWRTLLGLQFIPGTCMLIGSFWMPFSPRWLVLKGRYEEALEVLKRIHGGQYDETFYQREYHQIRAQIAQEKRERRGLSAIFTKRSNMRRVALVVVFFFFFQCTGIVPLSIYQVLIYRSLGVSPVLTVVLAGVYGSVTVLSVVFTGFWFDKIGRRNSLFLAYSIMIPASCIIVGFWALFEASGNTNLGLAKGVLFGIFLNAFGFAGVMDAFGSLYGSEIMPTNIRAAGLSCGFLVFYAISILLVQVSPKALAAISWRYFLIFLILDCSFVIIVFLFYPETKNRTLEEIAGVFGDKVAENLDEAGEQLEDLDRVSGDQEGNTEKVR